MVIKLVSSKSELAIERVPGTTSCGYNMRHTIKSDWLVPFVRQGHLDPVMYIQSNLVPASWGHRLSLRHNRWFDISEFKTTGFDFIFHYIHTYFCEGYTATCLVSMSPWRSGLECLPKRYFPKYQTFVNSQNASFILKDTDLCADTQRRIWEVGAALKGRKCVRSISNRPYSKVRL